MAIVFASIPECQTAKRSYSKKTYQGGILNALEFVIYRGAASKNQNPFSEENGFNIFIRNESTDSFSKEGIKVSTGFSTDIVLNKYSISY